MSEIPTFEIDFESFRKGVACSEHIRHMYQSKQDMCFFLKVEEGKKLGAGFQLPTVSSFFFDMIKSE